MDIVCPLCGRSGKDARFIGQFCENCIIAKLSKQMGGIASIEMCKRCGGVKNGMDYEKPDKRSMAFALHQSLKQKGTEIRVLSFDSEGAELLATCYVDNQKVEFKHHVALKTNYVMCGKCSRQSAGYYEALVQIRGGDPKAKTMREALERFITRRAGYITRVDRLGTGYDVYTSDKAATSLFFLKHKLKPRRSYTLSGMRKGKKLYRNIYSIRL